MVRSGLSTGLRPAAAAAFALALAAATAPALAYTPGSGTLYSANFEGTLDADWEQGNNIASCPWTQVTDGADKSFYADGRGIYPSSPTRHWARHFVTPVAAPTFSAAFAYRGEQGAGYAYDFEIGQRAPTLRKYRLRVDGGGALSLWRSENGVLVQKAATGAGAVPANANRWIRLQVDAGPGGHPAVHARAWAGGAAAEPGGWNVEFVDELDTLARVHNFELVADGPKGIRTWIDDLDVFGDKGPGIASSITKICIAEWTHLDIGFTLPPDDIEAYAKTHIDQVLQNLSAEPAYKWTIEEAWYLDRWWERSNEAQRQNLVAWLKGDRLRLAAGYASLHTTTAGHEELIRNIYWATDFARRHQVPLRSFIQDDVPGASFALPEILAKSGIDYYFGGMNTPFGGKLARPNHGDRPFWWQGPDGSRVLSWITFDAYAEAFDYGFSWFDNLSDMYRKLGRKLPEQEEAGYRYPELLLMRAFDNNYAGFKARDMVNAWNATYATPKFELCTPDGFMDTMRQKYGDETFPTFAGDFGCAWSNSHADAPHIERWVREAHRDGRAAEALLAAGSTIDGAPVPKDQLDFMYRRQLEVDEHSGAGGWPGYWTPEQMQRNNTIHVGYAEDARDTAAALREQGLDRAVAQVPAAGDAVVVVNALVRPRDGWARVALPPALYGTAFRLVERGTGAELPYQRFDAQGAILFRAQGLPSLGYKVYDLVPGAPSAVPGGVLSATATTLENDAYALTVDPADGALTSLVEKATGRQLIDAGAAYRFNRLAWNTKNELVGRTPPHAEPVGGASVSIETPGPLVAALRVTRTGTPHVSTVYRLYRGEDRVEIENTLDRSKMPHISNSEAARAYTVTLPFDVHDFEIRTESTTRFVDPLRDGFARGDVFDWHNVEHTLAFWDASGGIWAACDASDAHFFQSLAALSSTGGFSHAHGLLLTRLFDKVDEYEFEDGSVGPITMEPGTDPLLTFTHHVRGTPASFDPDAASRWGFEALNAPLGRVLGARPGTLPADGASFMAVEVPAGAAVVPYTVKRADDADGLIVRMTELGGVEVPVRIASGVFGITSAARASHDEDPGGTPLVVDAGGGVPLTLTPYETATVRVRVTATPGPISLSVSRDEALQAVRLQWTGGRAPFTLTRAEDPAFSVGVVVLVDHEAVQSFDDPVLRDGRTYFYKVE